MNEDFLSGVAQSEANIAGVSAKIPIFYRDARAFNGLFPANYFKLKRMLPDRRFVPAQVLPGVGAVSFSALEYYDTDIGPYNEFSIGILLNSYQFQPIPGYNLLRQYLQDYYYVYIYHLPVTTEVALRGGIDFYNYPKFMADINFSDTADEVICELAERGQKILELRGRKIPAPRSSLIKFFCHLYQDKQPQYAEFKVNALEMGQVLGPADVSISFGDSHPIARNFSDILLSERALMYIYLPKIQAILYGPQQLSFSLIQKGMVASGVLPEGKPSSPLMAGVEGKKKA